MNDLKVSGEIKMFLGKKFRNCVQPKVCRENSSKYISLKEFHYQGGVETREKYCEDKVCKTLNIQRTHTWSEQFRSHGFDFYVL